MGDVLQFEDESGVDRLVGTLHDPGATTGHVLTVLADKSIAAQPGGGGSGVQVVTVPVSSAEILDLFNTPVVLIPGVPGATIVLGGLNLAYIAGATPYTDNGGNISIGLQGGNSGVTLPGAGFWDQATSQIYAQGYGLSSQGAASTFDGIDLLLSEDTANPTLGDGTLLVTLSYFLAPTV